MNKHWGIRGEQAGEIDEVTDRELDALVAEKVMGGNLRDSEPWEVADGLPKVRQVIETPDGRVDEFSPSNDLASAWRVLKRVSLFCSKANSGPGFFYKPVVRIEWCEHDEIATVTVGRCKECDCDTDVSIEVWADESVEDADDAADSAVCHAICLAALKCAKLLVDGGGEVKA